MNLKPIDPMVIIPFIIVVIIWTVVFCVGFYVVGGLK